MSRLVLHLFGSPRVEVDGTLIEVDTRKAIALMAYLAVTGETHQRDTLAALLWPDYDQTNARAALRRTLSALNKALDSSTLDSSGAGFLDITRESIGLTPGANLWLDVREFRALLAALSAHGHAANEVCPACVEAVQAAAGLYREPFMAGFNLRDSPNFEEWQFFQEETLRSELSGALEKLVFGLGELNRFEEAVQYARRWLALDELQEDAHRQLMILYVQAGQRNAALRQYRECVRILDQELGVEPLEETTALYEAIMERSAVPTRDARLRFVPQAAPDPGRAPAGEPPAAPPAPQTLPPAAGQPPAGQPPAGRPLVGRGAERRLLQQTYQAVQGNSGNSVMIAVVGEAGIGKTRLAEDLIGYAQQMGARAVTARCYAGETGLAYAPFLSGLGGSLSALLADPAAAARVKALPPAVLAGAARLFPTLSALYPGGPGPDEAGEGARARFFESLRQFIAALLGGGTPGSPPGILFLDDLHWVDAASLDLLAYLARRLSGTGLVVLAAWRDEPGPTTQALDRLAGELNRAGQAVRVQLRRLEPAEIVELVRAYPIPAAEPEALGQRLFHESEGLPFVAVEYLAALAQQRAPESAGGTAGSPANGTPTNGTPASGGPASGGPANGGGWNWEIPVTVRDLLLSRVSELDAAAQQILSTAAVIGRSFDFNTLREVSGRSEFETVDSLDKLLSAGLVSEQAGGNAGGSGNDGMSSGGIHYDFTHEKLRALIYDETSLARRRLLHRRTAETLARPLPNHDQAGKAAGAIAYHYEQAGLEAQAAEYHWLAGERARRVFANHTALAHFQAALAAGHPDQAGLHEAVGDLYTLLGDYNAAVQHYRAAAGLCSPACSANLEHKLGNVHQRRGEWELAESHYQASLDALGSTGEAPDAGELGFHVHLYSDRSLAAYSRGRMEDAQQFAVRAFELARQSDDPHALAQANNMLGLLARARGDYDQAIDRLETSLRLTEELDDPTARIAGLNNLARVYAENAGQDPAGLERALALSRQALDLCIKRGDRHRQAALHNNIADLLHRVHREEEAMDQLKQAVVIFAEIENENKTPAGIEPAGIWKLTEW